MEETLKKSDFLLAPYMKRSNAKATFQMFNTLGPYFGLWALAYQLAPISLWFLPPILILMVLFSARCFSLMHDCGHYSLFESKRVNRIVGFIFGVVNSIPQYPWSRGHAYHHKTNGDWEKYRGPSALMSTAEFAKLTPLAQKRYALLRHPLMLFPGGFFYLAIKSRLALILGLIHLAEYAFRCLWVESSTPLSERLRAYSPKHWYTTGELWDLLFNNICVVGGWILLSRWLGASFFLGTYSIVVTCSAAIIIYVFFVQHNFEGSYAHKTEGWSYIKGAIEGSSYLKLPRILQWFAADIGYHNIHHLSERIPNYNLADCHHANRDLMSKVKVLYLKDMLGCAQFILWDADTERLISIEAFRQQTAPASKLAFKS